MSTRSSLKNRRRIFNWMTLLSLLLGIASAGCWIRSYWASDGVTWWNGGSTAWAVRGERGITAIYRLTERPDEPREEETSIKPGLAWESNAPTDGEWRFMGHGPGSSVWKNQPPLRPTVYNLVMGVGLHLDFSVYLRIPIAALVSCSVVLPVCWCVTQYRFQRKMLDNICLTCGYDLRASVERCPECGEPVPPATACVEK